MKFALQTHYWLGKIGDEELCTKPFLIRFCNGFSHSSGSLLSRTRIYPLHTMRPHTLSRFLVTTTTTTTTTAKQRLVEKVRAILPLTSKISYIHSFPPFHVPFRSAHCVFQNICSSTPHAFGFPRVPAAMLALFVVSFREITICLEVSKTS